jgi:hypothetical protein
MNVSSSEMPVTVQNVLVQKETALPFKLQTPRSFVEALVTASSRTVSKEERFTIVSTLYTVVDDMNVIDLSRTVFR